MILHLGLHSAVWAYEWNDTLEMAALLCHKSIAADLDVKARSRHSTNERSHIKSKVAYNR